MYAVTKFAKINTQLQQQFEWVSKNNLTGFGILAVHAFNVIDEGCCSPTRHYFMNTTFYKNLKFVKILNPIQFSN